MLLRISAGFLDSRSGLDLARLRLDLASGFHLLGFGVGFGLIWLSFTRIWVGCWLGFGLDLA